MQSGNDNDKAQNEGQDIPTTSVPIQQLIMSGIGPQATLLGHLQGIATQQASQSTLQLPGQASPQQVINAAQLSQLLRHQLSPGFATPGQVQQNITTSGPIQQQSFTSSGPAQTHESSNIQLLNQLQRQLSNPVPQMSPPTYQASHQVAAAVESCGATVHHLGQNPSRVAMVTTASLPALSNPATPTMSLSQQQLAQLQHRRLSSSLNSSGSSNGTTRVSENTHSPIASPDRARKRIKLEHIPPPNDHIANFRKIFGEKKLNELSELKENYIENLTELFFLQNGGNYMDYIAWKKRPTPQLIAFLKSGQLDGDDEDSVGLERLINDEVKVVVSSGSNIPLMTPVAISTSLPSSVAQISQGTAVAVTPTIALPQPPPYTAIVTTGVTTASENSNESQIVNVTASISTPLTSILQNLSTATSTTTSAAASQESAVVHAPKATISAVYDKGLGSQEAIVERAKQEAQVMQRIAELRKNGLWSTRRLPKVQEPPRNKAHWDYLLEEMQWLAADFAQERKWKRVGCRKIASMVSRYHKERQNKEIRAEKEEGLRMKRIAGNLAKQIKEFWGSIEKVVQYKQNSRLEEKRKKALDLQLNFIVDQTEKYSSWLTEGLGSGPPSVKSTSVHSSPSHGDDVEFRPTETASDDEETIEKEEELDETNHEEELEALKKESEVPIEEILKNLPSEILEKPSEQSGGEESDDSGNKKKSKEEDSDFEASDESDVEDTIEKQEKHEKADDHQQELDDLNQESEMSVEELRKKYAAAYDSDFEMPDTPSESEESEDETEESQDEQSEDEEEEDEVDDEKTEEEQTEDVGMEYLLTGEKEGEKGDGDSGPNKDFNDIAEFAKTLQPTGYTFETTNVRTEVPFLLKHTLREYQHIGLEWLATMYDRKLNGILADEMGLGKTIQTIALLAHLVCKHGIWGPHLIVVPTSVMLNWEMELKKWCPSLKILTYYGNQKERKQKRQGWTKTNAFHVCITSYKLVIQDHQSFRRKKWKYFILDEAQNIKNFKSQRWQMLLNFSSQRRLLLTGTPLQNSLMELWSLMHFLMPHVFASHREFKEWFSNPLSSMVEGSREYNESLIKRLHKVLRPFLLRRLKADVEKQMPKKFEHVVMCRLSTRQRFLYDDFMGQGKTKETLASGHFMSVINILMQLRKVCNHPNLFDPRPIVSPFQTEGLTYSTPSLVLKALEKDPLDEVNPLDLHPSLADMELQLPAFMAHRVKKLQTPRPLIEEIDSQPPPAPRPRPVRLKFRSASPAPKPGTPTGRSSPFAPIQQRAASPMPGKHPVARQSPGLMVQSPSVARGASPRTVVQPAAVNTTQAEQLPGYTGPPARATFTPNSTGGTTVTSSQPITLQIHHTTQGTRFMIPSGQLSQLPAGFLQIVQTSTGQQIVCTSTQAQTAQVQAVQPLQSTPTTSSRPAVVASNTSSTVVNGPNTLTQVTSGVSIATTSSVASSSAVTIATTSVNGESVTMAAPVIPTVRPVTTSRPAVQLPTTPVTSDNQKPVVRVSPMVTTGSVAKTVSSSDTTIAKSQSSGVRPSPSPQLTTRSHTKVQAPRVKSPLYMESLETRRLEERKKKLDWIATRNKRHCNTRPVYGQDLHNAVNVLNDLKTTNLLETHPGSRLTWGGVSHVNCHNVHNGRGDIWRETDILAQMIHTPDQYLKELQDVLNRFVFCTPSVVAPPIRLHASHPPPSFVQSECFRKHVMHNELATRMKNYHKIQSNMKVQFPELRLIQYDCGKLQTLDILLRRLKSGQHRVLLFTQMTKMLDVLEQFLNYHGHRYLRLDGTTKVEQRQQLMDRFNVDKRIFVFILSTRSGGIGVNLTGADTVIFYDSDWNPTMDAQAQDRCHRIGQTRDVHIYRLISERTVEENILKKANQKRLLGDVAIEGGNFTTAFFRENTIKELFEEPSGLLSLAKEKERRQQTREERREERENKKERAPEQDSKLTEAQMEQALCNAEDDTDVQAAKLLKSEQKQELAEFDETVPWDEQEAAQIQEKEEEDSKVEQELRMLEKELTPVERYAVMFMEKQMDPVTSEELQLAQEQVEDAKKNWELNRLKTLREEEERRCELEEDEMLFTYSREDATNKVNKKSNKSNKNMQKVKKGTSRKSKSEPIVVETEQKSKVVTSSVSPTRASSRIRLSSSGSLSASQSSVELSSSKSSLRARRCHVVLEKTPPSVHSPRLRSRLNSTESNSSGSNLGASASKIVLNVPTAKADSAVKTKPQPIPKQNKSKSHVIKEQPETVLSTSAPAANETTPKAAPVSKPTTPKTLQPSSPLAWSNPNLVIRTRRARQCGNEVPQNIVPSSQPITSQNVTQVGPQRVMKVATTNQSGASNVVTMVPTTLNVPTLNLAQNKIRINPMGNLMPISAVTGQQISISGQTLSVGGQAISVGGQTLSVGGQTL
ncbi:unnamed protein product, partial [Owenia fusiformis]